MAISTEYLHNRYMKANEALDKYGALIADRLSTGNTNPSQLQKFNLMSAWISFMSSKITVPSSIIATSPKSMSFPVPALERGPQKLTIGVDNIEGEFTTIAAFTLYNLSELDNNVDTTNFENLLNDPSTYSNRDFSFSYVRRSQTVTISFPPTGMYNDSILVFSPYPKNFEDLKQRNLIVKGGVSAETTVDYLSVEDRELFNKILEDMAIELKISY